MTFTEEERAVYRDIQDRKFSISVSMTDTVITSEQFDDGNWDSHRNVGDQYVSRDHTCVEIYEFYVHRNKHFLCDTWSVIHFFADVSPSNVILAPIQIWV